jgi:hypothetical protein
MLWWLGDRCGYLPLHILEGLEAGFVAEVSWFSVVPPAGKHQKSISRTVYESVHSHQVLFVCQSSYHLMICSLSD